jgi:hypothetical protein
MATGMSMSPRLLCPAATGDEATVGGASGALPAGKPEARKEVRVKVKWPARVQLAGGRVVELRVCDVSESGVALAGDAPITSHSVLSVAIAIPGLVDPARVTAVTGTMKTAHMTVRGPDLVYGGTWVNLEPRGRELIREWIKRLRG